MVKLKIYNPWLTTLASLLFFSTGHALELNGFTRYSQMLDINGATAGTVKSVKVERGQRVKAGDILIEIDATAHQARLQRARAIETSLKPAVETAQLEMERALELYDRDSLSQVEMKKAEDALAIAQGHYEAAQADTALAQFELQKTQLRSPIDSRVLEVYTDVSRYIDPSVSNDILLTLVNSRKMLAVAHLNTEQWDGDLINKKASVKFRDQQFNGRVSYLGFNRVKQSSGLPAYELHVTFETSSLIPAEMPVSINISQ